MLEWQIDKVGDKLVLRDDIVPGGTKQRVLMDGLDPSEVQEVPDGE